MNEDIKKNREEFKKKPLSFFLVPIYEYVVSNPLSAIGNFLFWFFIIFGTMTLAQAIYYDAIYCDCSDNRFDGRVMDTYNPFVKEYNNRTQEYLNNIQSLNNTAYLDRSYYNMTMDCGFNIDNWKQGNFTGIKKNIKKMVIERWSKDTN